MSKYKDRMLSSEKQTLQETLSSVIESLIKVANDLDEKENLDISDRLDKAADRILDVKVAQYVGIQGYWVRNQRCWANCYRHKRASDPKMTAHDVWFECKKEYNESINNDGSKWDKYASEEDKTELKKFASIADQEFFLSYIEDLKKEGVDLGSAIFESLAKSAEGDYTDNLVKEASALLDLAQEIAPVDIKLANEVYRASEALLKESQFRGIKNMYNRFRGRGRDFGTVQDRTFDPKKLQVMINDLGQTVDNYSHQRRLILQHLDEAAKFGYQWAGADEAGRIAKILRNKPLSRESLREINTVMAEMIGKKHGISESLQQPKSQLEPQSSAPTTAAETTATEGMNEGENQRLLNSIKMDEATSGYAVQAAREYFKKHPQELENIMANLRGSPIPFKAVAKSNKKIASIKKFNLKKFAMDLEYFRNSINRDPKGFVSLLLNEVYGGKPEAMLEHISSTGSQNTPKMPLAKPIENSTAPVSNPVVPPKPAIAPTTPTSSTLPIPSPKKTWTPSGETSVLPGTDFTGSTGQNIAGPLNNQSTGMSIENPPISPANAPGNTAINKPPMAPTGKAKPLTLPPKTVAPPGAQTAEFKAGPAQIGKEISRRGLMNLYKERDTPEGKEKIKQLSPVQIAQYREFEKTKSQVTGNAGAA